MKSDEEIRVLFISKVNEHLEKHGTIGEGDVRSILYDIWPATLILPEEKMRDCIIDMYNGWVEDMGHDDEAKWEK